MSGIKRKIEGSDPDYEDISLALNSKRNKAAEHNGKLSLCSEKKNTPALASHVMTAMNKRYSVITVLVFSLSFFFLLSVSPRSNSPED